LEKAVADTARVVDELKASHQAKIKVAISDANARLARAERHRQKFACDAQIGNPQAQAEVAKALAESQSAAAAIQNLQQAPASLVEAEREAGNACRSLARFEAEILIRERIEIAREIQKEACRNLERLYMRYDELGGQILSIMPDALQGVHGYESAMGANRVKNALPDFIWRLFFPAGAVYEKEADLAASEVFGRVFDSHQVVIGAVGARILARAWRLLAKVERNRRLDAAIRQKETLK
jgi:hypothetical protein